MRVAIEGCTHGELEKTYATLAQLEAAGGGKVDLLLCCGDFQSTRNLSDLKCMACPDKYKDMCSFYKYYSGEAIAPVLTIFIGGNHEASNYLQELAYGGWVAPNIYYLGYAGVVNVNGVRIGGLSGIYKGFDYLHGHHEKPPYDDNSMRSVYHIRNVDVFRLKQLEAAAPDIMMSHDWPRGVYNFGNKEQLVRYKKHFKEEVEQDRLGSGPTREIMDVIQPDYWFSAHLHCKFAALVEHGNNKVTKFLALDKCLPRRQFLQVVDIGSKVENDEVILKYDPHWLAILKSTSHLLSVEKKTRYTPGPGSSDRYDFRPSEEELEAVFKLFDGDLEVPFNFEQNALPYKPTGQKPNLHKIPQPQATVNRQTGVFCGKLGIADPMALLLGTQKLPRTSLTLSGYSNASEASFVNASELNISADRGNETFESSHVFDSPTSKSFKWIPKTRRSSSFDDDKEASFSTEPSLILDTVSIQTHEAEKNGQKLLRALVIPEPKSDNYEDVEDDNKGDTVETVDEGIFLIDKTGSTGSTTTESDTGSVSSQEDAAPKKKLKRRNASIYTSE